jgi:hypothetical protein
MKQLSAGDQSTPKAKDRSLDEIVHSYGVVVAQRRDGGVIMNLHLEHQPFERY